MPSTFPTPAAVSVPAPSADSQETPSGVHSPDTPLTRLRRVGLSALSDAELLALALGPGRKGLSSRSLARYLLRHHDGLRGLSRSGLGALSLDLGQTRAARFLAHIELARRARSQPLSPLVPLTNSRDVVRAWSPRLAHDPDESVVAIVLDARRRPVAERVMSHGTAAGCSLGLRELFSLVVRESGTSLVLVHNHPSGDPTPSAEDVTFTHAVTNAGLLLEAPLVDHVIIAHEGYFSFLDAGLLSPPKGSLPATSTISTTNNT